MFASLSSAMCRLPSTTWIQLFTLMISITLLTRPTYAKTLPDSMDIDEVAPREEPESESAPLPDVSLKATADRILNSSKGSKKCTLVDNEAMVELMNRVCELCHDMYSHVSPNMRFKCSSKCFRNATFKKCLSLFSPGRSLRHTLHRKHSSIVLD